jgi:hypothetical protein
LVGAANRLGKEESRHDGLKSTSNPHRGRRKKTFLTDNSMFFKMRPVSLTKKIVYVRDLLEVDD